MSNWTTFLTKFYNDKKKTNPDYQFKHAMKGAAKVYKKNTLSVEDSNSTRKMTKSIKSRRTKSGTRKSRRTKSGTRKTR